MSTLDSTLDPREWQTHNEGTSDVISNVEMFRAVVLVIALCAIIIGHGLVFASYILNKRMRTPMNFYILQLSVADIFVGVVAIPLGIIGAFQREWYENQPFCLLHICMAFLGCSVLYFL